MDTGAPLRENASARPPKSQRQRGPQFVTCHVCGSNFYKAAQLMHHMRSDHPETEIPMTTARGPPRFTVSSSAKLPPEQGMSSPSVAVGVDAPAVKQGLKDLPFRIAI